MLFKLPASEECLQCPEPREECKIVKRPFL
jgi:hypothetical protein